MVEGAWATFRRIFGNTKKNPVTKKYYSTCYSENFYSQNGPSSNEKRSLTPFNRRQNRFSRIFSTWKRRLGQKRLLPPIRFFSGSHKRLHFTLRHCHVEAPEHRVTAAVRLHGVFYHHGHFADVRMLVVFPRWHRRRGILLAAGGHRRRRRRRRRAVCKRNDSV